MSRSSHREIAYERTLQPTRRGEDVERDGEAAKEEAERLDDEGAVPCDMRPPTRRRGSRM
jgi:hypothetical protein